MKQIFLSLLMMLLPLMANAETVEIDGIYYNLITKGKIAEVTYNPNMYEGVVIIPESVTYEGVDYSVTSIGDYAFNNDPGLATVTIPNSVTSIGGSAFSGCSGLTSVNMGNGVTSIGSFTFKNCTGLLSITIPHRVTSIENDAFYGCSALTSVHISDLDAWCKVSFSTWESNPLYYAHHLYLNDEEIKDMIIPSSVTYIGNFAFIYCSGLTSVTIPNSVTNIEQQAFYYCSGLTSINIGSGLKSIGGAAFQFCKGLTSVIIPNSVTNIGGSAFYSCTGLKKVTLPNSVTGIGESAFSWCSGLTSIAIPNSVTSIGGWAFMNCSGLTSVYIGSGVKTIYSSSFANCRELTDIYCYAENVPSTSTDAFADSYIEFATLHVPASALNAYSNTEPWSNFKDKVAIGEVEPSYSLTYMLDGTKYREYSLQEGETITPDPAPIKEGFTFSGWSEIPETMPDHDVTITGTFIANTYLPGDANGDGQITVTDIGVIVDIILGKTPANARKQQEAEPQ